MAIVMDVFLNLMVRVFGLLYLPNGRSEMRMCQCMLVFDGAGSLSGGSLSYGSFQWWGGQYT